MFFIITPAFPHPPISVLKKIIVGFVFIWVSMPVLSDSVVASSAIDDATITQSPLPDLAVEADEKGVMPTFVTRDLIQRLDRPSQSLIQQRQAYSQLLESLASHDASEALSYDVQQRLKNYPLTGFLDYKKTLNSTEDLTFETVSQFKRRHGHHFFSDYISSDFASRLFRKKDWAGFLKIAQKTGATHTCRRLKADIELKNAPVKMLIQRAKKLWLVGTSQPSACDGVFEWLMVQKGVNTTHLYTQRARLVLENKNRSLAKYFAKKGSKQVQQEVEDWFIIKTKPMNIFTKAYAKRTSHNKALGIWAANQFLADSLELAESQWPKLKRRYHFDKKDQYAFEARMAKRSAQRHYVDALKRFKALPLKAMTENIHDWSIRAAIRVQDWQGVKQQIAKSPSAFLNNPEWQYWLARAEQGLGNSEQAKHWYEKARLERGYYGFLASERLDVAYSFNNDPSYPSEAILKQLFARYDVKRLREWVYHNQLNYARVELRAILKKLNKQEKTALAHIVQYWGWHEQSIRIMAKLGRYDDLPLRFALAYRDLIEKHSANAGIDPDWAQAIMRRESTYAADARSRVGATGLMQLMPRTAKGIAKQKGWSWQGVNSLFDEETNIRYGTTYLGQVSEEFNGDIPLVTASYNAGPFNVRKWLPKKEILPLDVWVATIPFKETRKYVQGVSEYMTVFKWRAAGEPAQFKQALNYTRKTVTPTASNKVQPST